MKERWESYLNRIFQNPMVDQFQTPARRRTVAFLVLAWQLLVVIAVYQIQFDRLWPVFVVALPMIYLIGMLNMSTRGMFELADRHLDEFQIGLRDAAFRRSYVFTLVWLLLTSFVVLWAANQPQGWFVAVTFILLGFLWGMSLPRVLVAWTMPADDADED